MPPLLAFLRTPVQGGTPWRGPGAEPLAFLSQPLRPAITAARNAAHPARAGARSSAVEHYLDTVGVTGSIPVAPTRPGSLTIARVSAPPKTLYFHKLPSYGSMP